MVQETVGQGGLWNVRSILQRCSASIRKSWDGCTPIEVDSPILTGQTDTEYLTKDFEGAYSPLGSIFTFAGARFSDSQVYLFAHNMASGQMFGSLKQFHERCVSGSKSGSLSVYAGACPETAGGRLEVSAGR